MDMDWLDRMFECDTLVMMIPIVAIIVGGVIAVSKIFVKHQERMAMIERGMHPDYPPDDDGRKTERS